MSRPGGPMPGRPGSMPVGRPAPRTVSRDRGRPQIPVPLLTPRHSSLWIGLVTPVDAGVAKPLIEGLATETVVGDPTAMARFGIEPMPLDEAMREAVAAYG